MKKEVSPNWQMGYDLEYLKGICSPFKAMHKPLVYGAFGLTKEWDVAGALKEGRCCYNEKRTACLFWKYLKRGSVKRDYCGRKFQYPKGALLISNFAATNIRDGSLMLMDTIESTRIDKDLVYIEIFEEDEIVKTIVESLGCLWLTSKITAGSEIVGIYKFQITPGLEMFSVSHQEKELLTLCDAHEVLGGDKKTLSNEELKTVRREIEGCSYYAQHYSSYNKRRSWTSFAIKGYKKDDPEFIIKPQEMSKKWKADNSELMNNRSEWTSIAEEFKESVKIAKRFGTLDRVRFMKLEAGGELSRHADITDREAGVMPGKVIRLHIPIYTNKDITFYSWDVRGRMLKENFKEGETYYLDQRKPHRVTNNSKEDRVHFVIDLISGGGHGN